MLDRRDLVGERRDREPLVLARTDVRERTHDHRVDARRVRDGLGVELARRVGRERAERGVLADRLVRFGHGAVDLGRGHEHEAGCRRGSGDGAEQVPGAPTSYSGHDVGTTPGVGHRRDRCEVEHRVGARGANLCEAHLGVADVAFEREGLDAGGAQSFDGVATGEAAGSRDECSHLDLDGTSVAVT